MCVLWFSKSLRPKNRIVEEYPVKPSAAPGYFIALPIYLTFDEQKHNLRILGDLVKPGFGMGEFFHTDQKITDLFQRYRSGYFKSGDHVPVHASLCCQEDPQYFS